MEATRSMSRNPLDVSLAALIAITVTYALAVTAVDSKFWAIQLEFTFWCTGWAVIAHRTFSEKHSGFPAWLLPFNVSWEAFAIRDYHSPFTGWVPIAQKPFFVLWFALSCVHLYGVSRFNRSEFTGEKRERYFWPIMIGLIVVLLALYTAFVDRAGGEVKHYSILGVIASPFISFFFALMMWRRKDARAISLPGNVLRMCGQYATIANRPTDELSPGFPLLLFAITLACDLVFMNQFMAKNRKEAEA